jgi:molybdopterin-biosynthesis enzyme MoeA-like protein
VRVELVLVGEELLEEWHGVQPPYIQEMLQEIGGDLAAAEATLGGLHVIGDDRGELESLLRDAEARGTDLVITFGGLGPTHDDRVREEVASLLGQGPPTPHPEAMAWLLEAYESQGIAMPERGQTWERMGHCPPGASPLRNLTGLAAGLAMSIGGTEVVCLPGVTIEALPMWREHVLPELVGTPVEAGAEERAAVVVRGLREGVVGPVVEGFLDKRPRVRAGVYLIDLEGHSFRAIRVVLRAPPNEMERALTDLAEALAALPGAGVEVEGGRGGGDAG